MQIRPSGDETARDPALASIDRAALERAALLPDDALTAYASGSVASGWGHENSDIDLYVVLESPFVLAAGSQDTLRRRRLSHEVGFVTVVHHLEGGRRWDVSYVTAAQLDQMIERASMALESALGDEEGVATDRELAFLGRLAMGLPIVGEDWYDATRERVRNSDFAAILSVRWLSYADAFLDDAAGLLRSGDYYSAVIAAHSAFRAAVDGLLASVGEVGANEFWRARQLERAQPPQLSLEDFWAVETHRDLDPSAPVAWIRSTVVKTQDVMGSIEFQDA